MHADDAHTQKSSVPRSFALFPSGPRRRQEDEWTAREASDRRCGSRLLPRRARCSAEGTRGGAVHARMKRNRGASPPVKPWSGENKHISHVQSTCVRMHAALKAGGGCWNVLICMLRETDCFPFINFEFCPSQASCYIHANVRIDGMRNGGIISFSFFIFVHTSRRLAYDGLKIRNGER